MKFVQAIRPKVARHASVGFAQKSQGIIFCFSKALSSQGQNEIELGLHLVLHGLAVEDQLLCLGQNSLNREPVFEHSGPWR